jgi:hypothetical protein
MNRLLLVLGLCVLGISFAGCKHEVRYTQPLPVTPDRITDVKDAWVRLFEKDGYTSDSLTVRYPQDVSSYKNMAGDNGKRGFDNPRSAKWQIPEGWQFVLYDDTGFKSARFPLVGSGKVESMPGPIAGHASSGRWERR